MNIVRDYTFTSVRDITDAIDELQNIASGIEDANYALKNLDIKAIAFTTALSDAVSALDDIAGDIHPFDQMIHSVNTLTFDVEDYI
jgi:hypothetical protein